MNIQKISDITAIDLAWYLRLTEADAEDLSTLNTLLNVAKSYIKSYTGQDDEGIDKSADYVIACFVLVQDMWDNRTLYVDNDNVNKVVESILNLHSINLLPKVET